MLMLVCYHINITLVFPETKIFRELKKNLAVRV